MNTNKYFLIMNYHFNNEQLICSIGYLKIESDFACIKVHFKEGRFDT